MIVAAVVMPLAIAVAPRAAIAEAPVSCWPDAATPGVFGWVTSPSIACRNGTNVIGAPVAVGPQGPPAPVPRSRPGSIPSQGTAPRSAVTFSGTAELGVAMSF